MLDLAPPLAVTLAPLVPTAGGVRAAIAVVARDGAHVIQMSAALKGIRPRELDRRARRDVLMLLSRHGLMLGGIDLMIPHRHWLQGDTQDRAIAAALDAIHLAADWRRAPLSLNLPVERVADDLKDELLAAADGHGVTLAIHADHDIPALRRWLEQEDQPILGAGVDPAAVLAQGRNPATVATELGNWVRVARLDDYLGAAAARAAASTGGRCPLGEGELDLTEYRAALATCTALRSIVLELRELPDTSRALAKGLRAWHGD